MTVRQAVARGVPRPSPVTLHRRPLLRIGSIRVALSRRRAFDGIEPANARARSTREIMDSGQVVVATITWARSPSEAAVLGRALRRLATTGLPVAVADAGTNDRFAEDLKEIPGLSTTVPAQLGLVAQVQASFQIAAASGKPFVLYVEPDKELFFESGLDDFLRRAPGDREVGVVLASRSPDSFRTFPSMQRYTEGVINRLCSDVVGCEGDYSYGPFLMNTALMSLIDALQPQLGWGWRHFVFKEAARRGLSVSHITGDYPCPPEQRMEDGAEQRHRLRQLSQNILGLIEPSPQL